MKYEKNKIKRKDIKTQQEKYHSKKIKTVIQDWEIFGTSDKEKINYMIENNF